MADFFGHQRWLIFLNKDFHCNLTSFIIKQQCPDIGGDWRQQLITGQVLRLQPMWKWQISRSPCMMTQVSAGQSPAVAMAPGPATESISKSGVASRSHPFFPYC